MDGNWSLLDIVSLLGSVLLGLKPTFKNLGYSLTTFDLLWLLHIKGSTSIAFMLLSWAPDFLRLTSYGFFVSGLDFFNGS
jgi:hypothetical protein